MSESIRGIYLDVLGREPDAAGWNSYTDALNSGALSYWDIRSQIAHSGEAAAGIQNVYQGVFGRFAADWEINTVEGWLGTGTTISQLRVSDSQSGEAAAAIQGVYQSVLGRVAADWEIGTVEGWLGNGLSIAQLRWSFAHSGEATSALDAIYHQVLGRGVDQIGITNYEDSALGVGWSLGDVRWHVAHSSEAAAGIDTMYRQVLGRPADSIGLGGYENALGYGQSLTGARWDMAHDTEAAVSIQNLYQAVFGRAAAGWEVSTVEGWLGTGTTIDELRVRNSQSSEAATAIQGVYQTVLGRTAADWEVSTVQGWLSNGLTIAQFRNVNAMSSVVVSDIQSAYHAQLGRDATASEIAYWQSHLADGSLTHQQLANISWVVSARLVLNVAENAWNGDAQFVVSIDGVQVGGVYTATAAYASGQSQTITIDTLLAAGAHTVLVTYLNDAWGGTADTDRNLYLLGASINGQAIPNSSGALLIDGPWGFIMNLNANSSPQTPPPPPVLPEVERLVLNVAEDAWQGDAQFKVIIDGADSGEVYTATASHAAGQVQQIVRNEVFTPGTHTVQVQFFNDLYGNGPDQDRNLYLLNATLNGQQIAGSTANLMSNGTASFNVTVGASTPAQATDHFIANAYTEVTGGQIDQTTLFAAEDAISAGSSLSDVRDAFAHSALAGQAIDLVYRQVLGRSATATEVSSQENALAAGGSLAALRRALAYSGEEAAELSTAGLGSDALAAAEAQIATGRSVADVRVSFAHSDAARAEINQAYLVSVGRNANDSEAGYWQGRMAQGLSIGEVRSTVATYAGYTPGSAPDWIDHPNIDLYENLGYDPAVDRQRGYASAFSVLTLVGADGQVIAASDARSLLALLPVYVTMYAGQSPNLMLADGRLVQFNDTEIQGNTLNSGSNAEQLAGYLLRTAQHADIADPLLASAYGQSMAWLQQVDQPAIQAAVHYAQLAQGYDAVGNTDQALLSRTASALLLQLAAEDPSVRNAAPTLSSRIQVGGHETVVTVAANGDVNFHDIDPGILNIVEALITIIVDVLAIFPPTSEVGIPLAIALHTAEAGQAFANGNVIGGVLNLAAAASFGLSKLGTLASNNAMQSAADAGLVPDASVSAGETAARSYVTAANIVQTASAVTGGVYGIVQGAQSGSVAGILGGVLETAGGVASGLGSVAAADPTEAISALTTYRNLQWTLQAAGALTSFGASIASGDIEGGLLNSLGPWLANMAASQYQNGLLSMSDGALLSDSLVSSVIYEGIDVAGKIWNLPNSAIGVVIGTFGYVAGMIMGTNPSITFGNNALQFLGIPFGGGGGLTLGNVQLFNGVTPNEYVPTYNDQTTLVQIGRHEEGHTYQSQALGIFFLPAYLLAGGIDKSNLFESSADAYGRGLGGAFETFK